MDFPNYSLSGKTALVTGASKGLGRHAALSLAHSGADLIVTGRNKEELEDLVTAIKALGRKAEALTANLENVSEATQLARKCLEMTSRVDILVNNAGVSYPQNAIDVTEEKWDKTFSVNLKSLFFLTQEIGKSMIQRGSGKIINMASNAGVIGLEAHAVYCSTKGALILLTRVLALEWGPKGINVNAIAPGVTLTPMVERAFTDPVRRAEILKQMPIGRFGKPVDVSGAVVFLSSSASDMVNGETLVIDGGYSMH
ncbi:MAG TPA: glucose 1-dehydrogenase [Thermodesulfobacteriota bacterium]|nr:glucose 1-dehydrogenase [Thermodesulfobacteriota bacterium]